MKKKRKPKTIGKRRRRDPHAQREAARYAKPIASREHILEMIADTDRPVDRESLTALLHIDTEDGEEALRRRLNAMVRDGQLVRNRRGCYAVADRFDLVRGRVIGHRDGFGFLAPDDGGEDVYLSARQMRTVFHDDRVLVRITGQDHRGRREGDVVEVLERNTRRLVGRYYRESGVNVVVPDSKRIAHEIAVPDAETGGAAHGQIVTVEIVEQPAKRHRPVGRIIEVLGEHMAPGMEIDIAIRSHDLPQEWPAAVEREIHKLGDQVPKSAVRGRTDLRDVPLVTIDGADARDFDDAVYCERRQNGWRLLVAIADVSHYVRPETALDAEADRRGTSVYFPERVIPMLPEVLSNGLCSINPDVDRLCMACELSISETGVITRSRFIEAVMRSHARFTYDQVAGILVDEDTKLHKKYRSLVPHLEELQQLYRVLRKAREQRGAIDFETTETRIVFGAHRKIDRIVPLERNVAHKMIEECMIAANVAAARFLVRHKMPTLFRVHARPEGEKLEAVQEFLGELGLALRGGTRPAAKDYAKLLEAVEERPDEHLINTVLLRSLPRAEYHPENIGHFGLAHEKYVHFTSPIRRYPDLLVHRAIRHILSGGKVGDFRYTHADMQGFGDHCSMAERRADDASRDVVDWLKCEYMLDKIGESYPGIISSVTSFGIFVELQDIYVEGLVHVTALGNDYYHYDPAHHRLMGERTNRIFRLGDAVRVKVMQVNLDERKIDFELIERESVLGKRRKKRREKTAKRRGRR
ncbi:MAG: ribonuclease R [Gammaproteobacteria bacterium]|nr:MAG: ribonuclease R [Gammaproteobacteria bacterium]